MKHLILTIIILSLTACKGGDIPPPSTPADPHIPEATGTYNPFEPSPEEEDSVDDEEEVSFFHKWNPLPEGVDKFMYEYLVDSVDEIKNENNLYDKTSKFLKMQEELQQKGKEAEYTFFMRQANIKHVIGSAGVLIIYDTPVTIRHYDIGLNSSWVDKPDMDYSLQINRHIVNGLALDEMCGKSTIDTDVNCYWLMQLQNNLSVLISLYTNRYTQGEWTALDTIVLDHTELVKVLDQETNNISRAIRQYSIIDDLALRNLNSVGHIYHITEQTIMESRIFWKKVAIFLRDNKDLIKNVRNYRDNQDKEPIELDPESEEVKFGLKFEKINFGEGGYYELDVAFEKFIYDLSMYNLASHFDVLNGVYNLDKVAENLANLVLEIEENLISNGINNSLFLEEFIDSILRKNDGWLKGFDLQAFKTAVNEYEIPSLDVEIDYEALSEERRKAEARLKEEGSRFIYVQTIPSEERKKELARAVFFSRED